MLTGRRTSLAPEETHVMLTEPPLASAQQRLQIVDIMFNTLNVPALSFVNQAVAALYAR
jgi:actin-related protein